MSLTQLRARRLRRPGDSTIEEIIIRQQELKELLESGRQATREDICRAITSGIKSSVLSPGDKLPSIRRLGQKLGVRNGVVRRAFEYLLSRGWLEMIHGSGTYVSRTANLLVDPTNSDGSNSVLRRVAEELTALYSTNSLIANGENRQIVHAHPRLRHRP
jgi:DNA-binding transcriptional regulator YhcF (GntR family)